MTDNYDILFENNHSTVVACYECPDVVLRNILSNFTYYRGNVTLL